MGPAELQGRRHLHLPGEPGVPVQPLHGLVRHAGRAGAGEHRAVDSRSGTTSRPGTSNALAPITRSYTLGVGKMDANAGDPFALSTWVQDDWQIGPKLTLNLGRALRPDDRVVRRGGRDRAVPAVGPPQRHRQRRPARGRHVRADRSHGAARRLRQVLRRHRREPGVLDQPGGAGAATSRCSTTAVPDFVTNPFNGPVPTFDQVAQTTLLGDRTRAGCLRRTLSNTLAAPENEIPVQLPGLVRPAAAVEQHRWRSKPTTSTPAMRKLLVAINRNLAYNPATGANYPYNDVRYLPYPDWGVGLAAVQHRRVELSRAAGRFHEAHEQPLAGVGDVSAARGSGTCRTRRSSPAASTRRR